MLTPNVITYIFDPLQLFEEMHPLEFTPNGITHNLAYCNFTSCVCAECPSGRTRSGDHHASGSTLCATLHLALQIILRYK